jgi:hypothetical protein
MEELLPVLGAQVDRHAALRAVVDDPRVVVLARGIAGAAHAVDVTRRGLHLDDVGPEVRHDGGRHGACDEIRGVDHADPVEKTRHAWLSLGEP